jgi:hypothetical protein
MTAREPDNDVHHGQLVAREVARGRARLRLVRLVRVLSLAVPSVALAVTLTGALGARFGGIAGFATDSQLAASGAAVLVVLVILTWYQTPALREVGTLLDARLDLADRTVAALDVGDRTGSVARLIVADAATRIASWPVARVFPIEMHPRAGVATAAATVALALFVFGANTTSPIRDRSTAGAGPGIGTGAGSNQGQPRTTAASDGARDRQQQRRPGVDVNGGLEQRTPTDKTAGATTDVARDATASAISRAPRDVESPVQATGRTQQTARGESVAPAVTPSARTAQARAAQARAEADRDAALSPQPRSTSGAQRADARGSAEQARTAVTPAVSSAARPARMSGPGQPGRGTAGARSGAAGAAGVAATAAGGVAGGQLARGQSPQRAQPQSVTPQPTAPQSVAGIDVLSPRDEVPPQRRRYVRDYFRAVQSTTQP